MHRYVECSRCKQRVAIGKGLCNACYGYQYRYGRPRPAYLFDGKPRRCTECGYAIKLGGQSRTLCGACYMRDWRKRHAAARPQPVIYDAMGRPWTQLPLPLESQQ